MNRVTRKWSVLVLIGIIFCLWAQEAQCSVILKTMVVNPSRTKTQKAALKAYLPREAKPEDVLDLADLKIAYDIEKGLYYVYKQVELKPGESTIRQVEIKDIWIILESELEVLSEQAKEIVQKLRNTNYSESALTLSKDIDEKQADIIKTQNDALNALPQEHIAVYRTNVEKLDKMKANLAKLENMFLEYKLAMGVGSEKVSVKASWWIILAVIISLGLISFAFFIIWHKQAGVFQTKRQKAEEEVLPEDNKS